MTDNSWVSALIDGRVTGSGSIFGGVQNPLETGFNNVKADGAAAIAKARADALAAAKAAAGQVVQNGVNTASPGAVILTRNTQLALAAGGAVLAVALYRKK